MDTIFFEKQIARLCAQHALNMLLQDSVFDVDDLAVIARNLDEEERNLLEPDARDNFQGQNMDDSGFFSIQVIQAALQQHNLRAVSIDQPSQAKIKGDPSLGQAFICNLQQHWFTVRRFGRNNWFILDSTNDRPIRITANYLRLHIAQLDNDGYSIFVIEGDLPVCGADLIEFSPSPNDGANSSSSRTTLDADEAEEIRRAIELSKRKMSSPSTSSAVSLNERVPFIEEDDEINRAIELSKKEMSENYQATDEDSKKQRQEEGENMQNEGIRRCLGEIALLKTSASQTSSISLWRITISSQSEPQLAENESATAPIDPEELRQKRKKFLDSLGLKKRETSRPSISNVVSSNERVPIDKKMNHWGVDESAPRRNPFLSAEEAAHKISQMLGFDLKTERLIKYEIDSCDEDSMLVFAVNPQWTTVHGQNAADQILDFIATWPNLDVANRRDQRMQHVLYHFVEPGHIIGCRDALRTNFPNAFAFDQALLSLMQNSGVVGAQVLNRIPFARVGIINKINQYDNDVCEDKNFFIM